MSQRWLIALVLGFTCGLPVVGWCQTQRTTRDRSSKQRERAVAQLLQGLDRNQDGILQTEEIPRSARLQVALAARRRGLDPSRPLPLAELTKPIAASPAKPAPAKPTPADASAAPDKKENQEEKASIKADARPPAGVPGFGVPDSRPPVPGFGVSAAVASGTGTDASAKDADGKESASSTQAADARIRKLARSMMAQHDKNGNGQLEREEWRRMKGKPKEADRNGDGILSLDELTDHLAAFGSRRKTHSAPRSSAGQKAAARSNKPPGARRTYRFIAPHERLPKGLPDWFAGKDADLDGQVAMAEFSAAWTQSKLDEFNRFDLNGDGFIVPKECLRVPAGK